MWIPSSGVDRTVLRANVGLGTVVFVVYATGLLKFRGLGLDFHLPFATLLSGMALICQMSIYWAVGVVQTSRALIGGIAGAGFVAYSGAHLANRPDAPPALLGFLLVLTCAVAVGAWRRTARS